jgi:hypothetical protein
MTTLLTGCTPLVALRSRSSLLPATRVSMSTVHGWDPLELLLARTKLTLKLRGVSLASFSFRVRLKSI